MAELWKLPVVYIIENNRYAMGTSVARASAQTDFSQARHLVRHSRASRSTAWTCAPCARPAQRAIEHARSGKGPYILEMQTYRYRGHSMSDPAKYRTKDEVTKMRDGARPDREVRKRLVEKHKVAEDELKEIDAKVRAIVTEAAEFATNDPRARCRPSSGPTSCSRPAMATL